MHLPLSTLALFTNSSKKPQPIETPKPVVEATPTATGITPAEPRASWLCRLTSRSTYADTRGWADPWEIDKKIRQHTWDMSGSGGRANSGQTFNGSKLPYWETWCGTEEVFGGTCRTGKSARPGRPLQSGLRRLPHVARLWSTIQRLCHSISSKPFNKQYTNAQKTTEPDLTTTLPFGAGRA